MLNYTSIQGRITADPELRSTQNGTPVCSFTIAWSEKYGDKETKLFLPCVAWKGTAEIISKYFQKGQEMLLDGKLSTRSWTDNDGNNRSAVELTVSNVYFCGPRQNAGNSQQNAQSAPNTQKETVHTGQNNQSRKNYFVDVEVDDGELPF